jgi:hypothetical protein
LSFPFFLGNSFPSHSGTDRDEELSHFPGVGVFGTFDVSVREDSTEEPYPSDPKWRSITARCESGYCGQKVYKSKGCSEPDEFLS